MTTKENICSIGELVKKHRSNKSSLVCLYPYVVDYLNEENSDLFYTLMKCTTFSLFAKINEDNVVEVNDGKKNLYATFDYDYPVVDVYKDLLFKMSKDVELCMMYLRKQYIEEGGEFRIWSDDVAKFKALREFATDYGLDITQRKKNNIPYIDIIGISPLPITSNSNAIETIGDFVTKHTADGETDVKLHWHAGKYLNEEDSDMFLTLIDCTTGFDISVEIGKNRTVNVYDSYGRFYTSYEYDYPVVDVYKTLLTKMSADVKRYLKSVKEQYAQNKDLRISGLDNPRIYNVLCNFSQNFGIEVEIGEENREPYVDIIGINE